MSLSLSVAYSIGVNHTPRSIVERVAYVCKKEKTLAGREPTTCGFERQRLSPTPCRPAVFCSIHINHIIAERRHNTTGRVGVLVGRWRSKQKVVGLRLLLICASYTFAPRTRFSDIGDAFGSWPGHMMQMRYSHIFFNHILQG